MNALQIKMMLPTMKVMTAQLAVKPNVPERVKAAAKELVDSLDEWIKQGDANV